MDTKTLMKVSIKLVDPKCLPQRKTVGAVGYDLVARESAVIFKGQTALIPVGFALELPVGTEAQIRGRSSLNNKGIIAMFGTIDSDYRGEVKVVLMNLMALTGFQVNRGDRIAQMVIASVLPTELVEVAELAETARGEGGFGSTDLKVEPPIPTAVIATDEDIARVQVGPSIEELMWAENQQRAARDWQNAHDPFLGGERGDLNTGTDS